MADGKFYKTSVTFVVLSEDPIPSAMDIDTIMAECDEGGYVLHSVPAVSQEILDRVGIDNALIEAGSDPSFFDNLSIDGGF